jgi:hypothetical protein
MPMTFTMAVPGASVPPPRRPAVLLAPLAPGSGWCRRTKDGIWAFAREEDSTTSWTVRHLPTKTVTENSFGSLRQCRAYVGSGEAQEDLERIQAEGEENGDG